MVQIVFVEHNGATTEVDVDPGVTVMQAALDNGIDGIIAECGGACSCATCHCYVDDVWAEKLDPPSDIEKDMLECVLEPKTNSRLACQIFVTNEMDGLKVSLPESQY